MAAPSSTAATIISSCCRLGPPSPPEQAAAGARRPQAPAAGVSASHALRGACVAAAACAAMGMAGGGDIALARDGASVAAWTDAMGAARTKAPARWSERRQCPPWRANSLENVVPENLPRPPAPRRFDSVSVSAAAPDLVAPPSSVLAAVRPGTGCFSL